MNEHEQRMRERKVIALVSYARGKGLTADALAEYQTSDWRALAREVGVNAPSATSIAAVVGTVRSLEELQATNPDPFEGLTEGKP